MKKFLTFVIFALTITIAHANTKITYTSTLYRADLQATVVVHATDKTNLYLVEIHYDSPRMIKGVKRNIYNFDLVL